MTVTDVVAGFLAALGIAHRALIQSTVGVDRSAVGQPLTATSVEGGRVRSGQIDGVGCFRLHGSGCLVELESGEDVDFDWDPEGRAIFDVWRLRVFARSIGEDEVTDAELAEAVESFVRAGILEAVVDGWFRVA